MAIFCQVRGTLLSPGAEGEPGSLQPPLSGAASSALAGPSRSSGRTHRHQFRHPYEVVGRCDEVGPEVVAFDPSVARLAKSADCLHPAEDLLDALPFPLAERVARIVVPPRFPYSSGR